MTNLEVFKESKRLIRLERKRHRIARPIVRALNREGLNVSYGEYYTFVHTENAIEMTRAQAIIRRETGVLLCLNPPVDGDDFYYYSDKDLPNFFIVRPKK